MNQEKFMKKILAAGITNEAVRRNQEIKDPSGSFFCKYYHFYYLSYLLCKKMTNRERKNNFKK